LAPPGLQALLRLQVRQEQPRLQALASPLVHLLALALMRLQHRLLPELLTWPPGQLQTKAWLRLRVRLRSSVRTQMPLLP
jgi:hypothetical protein